MSVDSGTRTATGPPVGAGCRLCGAPLGSRDGRVLQCYPEDGGSAPDAAAADGFLGVCSACGTEVDELVSAWTGHADPPVGADWSIAAGYRRVTDDCSFCDRPLGEEPILGVEFVPADDPGPDGGESSERDADRGDAHERAQHSPEGYANYTLCGNCVPVFDQFLAGVGDGDG